MSQDKIEEETYSLIFTSLKHPIRRKILRILSEKPLGFSEILAILAIDSGHLSYHLENLGELVLRSEDNKYRLSGVGAAAVKLMSGVEEHKPAAALRRGKPVQLASKAYSIVVALALLVACISLITYTTIASTTNLNQDYIKPTPFIIGPSQTFEFNITIEHWSSGETPIGSQVFTRTIYVGPDGPQALTVEVPPSNSSLTASGLGSLWLDLNLNTTVMIPNNRLASMDWLEYMVPRPFGFPNNLLVDVHLPNGKVLTSAIQWSNGNINHFLSPIVYVTEPGTYRFEIRNTDSFEWTGTLKPNVQWQQLEKPYFYYGIVGIAVASGYLAFSMIEIAQHRRF